MIAWLTNLSLVKKIALPIALLLIALGAVVWTAHSGLNQLTQSEEAMADQTARRLELSLAIQAALNNAAVSEKNAILDNDAKDIRAYIDSYEKSIAEAKAHAETLIAMADTSERRSINQGIKDLVTAYDAVTRNVLVRAQQNDDSGAYELSSSEGRAIRRKIVETMEARVLANKRDMNAAQHAMTELASSMKTMLLEVSGIGTVVALGLLVWMMTQLVVRPLTGMTQAMERLARGDLDTLVNGADRKDEVGVLARALQVFRDGALAQRRLEDEQAVEQRAKAARAEKVDTLIKAFESTAMGALRTVAAAASELDATAQSMATIAQQTNSQAGAAASAADLTSANVQTVATAAEEMAASIQEIGLQVTRSTTIAGQAVEQAAQTNSTVSGLANAAQKIGDVVSLIQDIASKTNLLALNATIEAARAGEAGKGFAVVASEVKTLASQTAKATEEIAAQIGSIQDSTGSAVRAIQSIGSTINSINDISTSIAAAIEEQGAATGEISRNVQQAAQGTQEVSGNVTQVRQAAEETGAAAGQVLGAAGELSREAETLRRDVEQFLLAIKAA
ncbi:methyl-accepting chemotaxis protein [Azospirillum sp. SYSU D00513]|uniref:methyl-accepting chemotaxis protein n=1 Tax=Azospirillum sp. SYSU D00513 TaxID=2812561 RepID=UPI001A973AA4|nr:methyl-accepting chemotaxis protein [Azospirillum sp. SYSU D00513]